jgi:hypothetical protein
MKKGGSGGWLTLDVGTMAIDVGLLLVLSSSSIHSISVSAMYGQIIRLLTC